MDVELKKAVRALGVDKLSFSPLTKSAGYVSRRQHPSTSAHAFVGCSQARQVLPAWSSTHTNNRKENTYGTQSVTQLICTNLLCEILR